MKCVALSWSGGKDSSLALYRLQKSGYRVEQLLCTLNTDQRVTMHGVSKELIELQSESISLPIRFVDQFDASNEGYEQVMKAEFSRLANSGLTHIAFGDIFLKDLREYREYLLEGTGLKSLYPLWKEDTSELLQEFLSNEFETRICSGDLTKISRDDLGEKLTMKRVKTFDKSVDPCGENGEFHTFCVNGPIFKKTIEIKLGEVITQRLNIEGSDYIEMAYIDLMPH